MPSQTSTGGLGTPGKAIGRSSRTDRPLSIRRKFAGNRFQSRKIALRRSFVCVGNGRCRRRVREDISFSRDERWTIFAVVVNRVPRIIRLVYTTQRAIGPSISSLPASHICLPQFRPLFLYEEILSTVSIRG